MKSGPLHNVLVLKSTTVAVQTPHSSFVDVFMSVIVFHTPLVTVSSPP